MKRIDKRVQEIVDYLNNYEVIEKLMKGIDKDIRKSLRTSKNKGYKQPPKPET